MTDNFIKEISALLEDVNTVKLAAAGFTDEAQAIGLARIRCDELLKRMSKATRWLDDTHKTLR